MPLTVTGREPMDVLGTTWVLPSQMLKDPLGGAVCVPDREPAETGTTTAAPPLMSCGFMLCLPLSRAPCV